MHTAGAPGGLRSGDKIAELTISKRVQGDYADTVSRVKAALAEEGFGVLTEIDMRAPLHDKLGVDFRDYLIIGACNPPLAHRALEADLGVGALLPCNVIVYADGDATVVSMFDPAVGMSLMSDPADPIALEAETRLQRVLASV